ncbi:hypothetical protein HYY74_01380 [Candidatus Woesearchaeota archaeon]|nr:hypothetical protein [Candidatus Woesearchaeota archaeon]
MPGKKGYIVSYGDWFKGLLIGVIVGAALVYFFMSGVVKLPFGPAQTAKVIVPVIPFVFRK